MDSMRIHEREAAEDWKTELRADAGGYYIYLPGFIHHRMRTGWLSADRLRIIGDAVKEDTANDILLTKYTCGTALLQLPFFLSAELIEGWGATDGFSPTHHRAIDVAGIVYWWAGLLFLWSALQHRWKIPNVAGLVLLFIMSQGTNVFYYAFRSPGYSHICSWFLVCLALWCWSHGMSDANGRWRGWVFRIACAWLILIRPLDIVLVIALYAFVLIDDPKGPLRPRWILGQVVVGLVLALPQMLYWKAAYGSWIFFSYQGEGFHNWRSPFLLQTLLAPKNGWLTHAPSFLLLPLALWAIWKHARGLALTAAAMFLVYWYAVSSWSEPSFGCSFGQRSLVQTVPVLAMITWLALHRWWPARRRVVLAVLLPFVGLALINHMFAHLYDMCFWSTTWDWAPYLKDIGRVLK